MAESSTPATPSRFNMGAQNFSRFLPEDDGYRPPTLTAQGREDVERLRAKVRKHNPGYIYANGVSLPAQLPSVPELLDELADNVRMARTDRDIPNTPLPPVEASELAKAGFDWKAIADRAIQALETGSRRPLPLANDPEAAQIPGLDVIAAMPQVAVQPAEEAPAEPAAEEPIPEASLPYYTPDTAPGMETAEDETIESSATEATGFEQTAGEVAPPPVPELGEPLVHAPEADVEVSQSAEIPEVTEETEIEELPNLDTDLDFAEEPQDEIPQPVVEVQPGPPAQDAYFETENTGLFEAELADATETLENAEELPEELPEALPEDELDFDGDFSVALADAEDLTDERVYDDDVLEPSGNDDELFVGDVDGEMAHWEVGTEDDTVTDDSAVMETLDDVEALPEEEAATSTEEEPAEGVSGEIEDTALEEYGPEELPETVDLMEASAEDVPADAELAVEDSELDLLPDQDEDLELPGEMAPAELPQPEIAPEESQDATEATSPEELPLADDLLDDQEVDLADLDLGDLEDLEDEELQPEEMPLDQDVPQEIAETVEEPQQESVSSAEGTPVPPPPMADVEETAEPTALPGSEAIGSENPEDEMDLLDTDDVDLGEFGVDDMEVPEALGEAESVESLGLPGEALPESLEDETAEPAEEVSLETMEEETDQDLEIPQVQGDIPEAMQEGFTEWTPSGEAQDGADTELFTTEETEAAEPAKPGFFAKLFGKKPKNGN